MVGKGLNPSLRPCLICTPGKVYLYTNTHSEFLFRCEDRNTEPTTGSGGGR